MSDTPSSAIRAEDEAGDIVAALQRIDFNTLNQDRDAKQNALKLSKRLTAVLEGPSNQAIDLMFKPLVSIAARIAVDLDIFSHLVSSLPDSVTSQQLAVQCKGEEVLVSRILRVLASIDFVEETGKDTWKANQNAKEMSQAVIAAGHRFVFDVLISSAIKAPKYLRENGFKPPTEPTDGFIQYANQTKLHVFDYLVSNPSLFQSFNLFMGNTMGARDYWIDWYDVSGRVLDGFNAENGDALIVDVGGGKGHDLQAFHDKFEPRGYSGALVLQDQPQILESIPEEALSSRIQRQAQDFFTPQKVKGARVYFLHHILHDWADKYCFVILKQLREAMSPGYSKLLIHELILPDVGANEFQARYDLTMMTFNGGMERSKSQWTKLLTEAGFSCIEFFEHFDEDGIIEAMVVPE